MKRLLVACALAFGLNGCMGLAGGGNVTTTVPDAAVTPGPDNPLVTLETELGTIRLELFEDEAPNTVANFISLADQGYYDGTRFHRVIKGFMMQGGDPNSKVKDAHWGSGGPGYSIPDEPGKGRGHETGTLSMANSGAGTGGSQFFIMFGPKPHLNGRHTIFGRVIGGMDVVRKFEAIGSNKDAGVKQTEFPKLLTAKVDRKRPHAYAPTKN